jgi:hypothetical protein
MANVKKTPILLSEETFQFFGHKKAFPPKTAQNKI